jgi:hypothetical protein
LRYRLEPLRRWGRGREEELVERILSLFALMYLLLYYFKEWICGAGVTSELHDA